MPSKIPLPTTGVGDEHTPQKSMPVMKAAAGQVMIQPPKMIAQLFQLTDCVLPLHRPTATVPPVTQWVVDTGMPSFDAIKTVTDQTIDYDFIISGIQLGMDGNTADTSFFRR